MKFIIVRTFISTLLTPLVGRIYVYKYAYMQKSIIKIQIIIISLIFQNLKFEI